MVAWTWSSEPSTTQLNPCLTALTTLRMYQNGGVGRCLGWSRIGNQWALATRNVVRVNSPSGAYRDRSAEGEIVLLQRAPRHVRIAAAQRLEAFLDALRDGKLVIFAGAGVSMWLASR